MKVGICDREVIPPFRKLKFTEENGAVTFYTLFFEVDEDLIIELNRTKHYAKCSYILKIN
jgi:hypothetical protein